MIGFSNCLGHAVVYVFFLGVCDFIPIFNARMKYPIGIQTFKQIIQDGNDFRFSSGTPEYLMRLLAKNDKNMNELVEC